MVLTIALLLALPPMATVLTMITVALGATLTTVSIVVGDIATGVSFSNEEALDMYADAFKPVAALMCLVTGFIGFLCLWPSLPWHALFFYGLCIRHGVSYLVNEIEDL